MCFNIHRFKNQLACVFDDDLRTKLWHNILDWIIIALILISTVEIFLSTFSDMTEKYGAVLNFIDIFTTVFFTIEVSLRIWVADAYNAKYKGFLGRVRYCFSFYGFLDFISTYTVFLGLIMPISVAALKALRVMRLFRVFRYLKSFQILGDAIYSKRQELTISLAFLTILTVILSFLLYFAECGVQPELFPNGWKTMIWAFAKYLGDPGKIADFPLMTAWGNVIGVLVGALGICIFAVPAGLIGSGFIEVIEEKRQEEKIKNNIERIRHSFRWEKDQHFTNFFLVPPFKSIDNILTKQILPENEILEAVKISPNLHLFNLADAYNTHDAPQDRIVVVACPNNRPYGYCVDRGSNVTIVSTSGYTEPITSWVAYHIAKIGGFNYVSKETENDPDNPVSYLNIDKLGDCPNLQLYINDINSLSSRPDSWVIPICFSTGPKNREHSIHLCYSPVKHDCGYENPAITFTDVEKFDMFAKDLSETLNTQFGLKTDCNDYYVAQDNKNLIHHINCSNGFTLRFEAREMYFPADKVAKIKTLADLIGKHFDPDTKKMLPEELIFRPKNCFGYDGYIC